MIAYNKEWIDNLNIQKQATKWRKKDFITAEELAGIQQTYATGYRESNIFARIGMFLFSLVLIISAEALFGLAFLGYKYEYLWVHSLLFGIVLYIAAEFVIRERQYFRSGLMDGLIYSSVFGVSTAIVLFFSGSDYPYDVDKVYYFICILPFILYASLRFADAFLTLIAVGCLLVINALLFFKLGDIGKQLLSFEVMLLAAAFYLFVKREKTKESNRFFYKNIIVAEILSIVIFYAAGNYYVVRELGQSLNNIILEPGQEIPLAYFFYAFSVVIPLLLLWQGLKKKDSILIRLGLLLEVAGILTIRHYHSIMPAETAMILGGAFLAATAWFSIRYLSTPKHGITYLQNEDDDAGNLEIAGSLVLAEMAGRKHAPKDSPFGGGSFGGGGASSSY